MRQREMEGNDAGAAGHPPWLLRLVAVAMSVVVLVVVSACGGSSKPSSSSGGGSASAVPTTSSPLNKIWGTGGKAGGSGVSITTGMLLAVTGQGAFFGRVMSHGAQLAASQIKGAGGPTFNIKIGDHQSGLIPAGVSATRQLITQDGIKWLQTSYGAVSEAIIPLIQQSKILTFNGGGTSPGQIAKNYLWNNRMVFGDAPAPGDIAYLAKAYPNAKRLAIVGTNENGVEAEKTIIPQGWPKVSPGGQVVDTEIVNSGLTDFGSTIARIKAARPDAIVSELFGNDPGYFVKQLRQDGVTVPFINAEFTSDACKVAGSAYDTFQFGQDYFDPNSQNPYAKIFVEAYKKAYNEPPDFYAANYYEQQFVMWELIRRVLKNGGDPTNSTDLQKALLENTTFPSVYAGGPGRVGTMTFDPQQHTITKPMGVFKVKNCQPEKVATIKAVGAGVDPASALVSIGK